MFEQAIFCLLHRDLADRHVAPRRLFYQLRTLCISNDGVESGHDNGVLRQPAFRFFTVRLNLNF